MFVVIQGRNHQIHVSSISERAHRSFSSYSMKNALSLRTLNIIQSLSLK
jgi:hypothetical protein